MTTLALWRADREGRPAIIVNDLRLRVNLDARGTEVQVMGELNVITVDVFQAVVGDQMGSMAVGEQLTVQFEDCTFCDSAGIAALIWTWRGARAGGLTLHLSDRPAFLERLLEMCGLVTTFDGP